MEQYAVLRVRLEGAKDRFYPADKPKEHVRSGTEIMKVLFTEEAFFESIGDLLYLFNHCALKGCCEAVVEGMGSVVGRHASDLRGSLAHEKYTKEAIIHWNGPESHEAEKFLVNSLDVHFKGKRWNFYPEGSSIGSKHLYLTTNVSKVIDRRMSMKSKFPFYT